MACWYQRNIELIAVLSSSLVDLSMQHVSTQQYSRPSLAARSTQKRIFLKPALFIRGGKSDYITTEDKLQAIPALFPNSAVETLPNVGHWVHAEAPDQVFELVSAFVGQ